MNTYPTVAWLTELDLPWVTRQSWPNPNIAGSTFWAAAAMSRPITKIVVHSTETTGWPGYRNGADNPNFTQHLVTGECRQHVPLTHGARALEVRATSEANIGGVLQVEVIGACTPGYPEQYGHYDLVKKFPVDEQAQFYLARLFALLHDVAGVPLETTVEWVVYPTSYGDGAVQRLTVAQFFAYAGVLGHQHVPGNSHGDPGNLGGAIGRVLAKAKTLTSTSPTPTPTPEVPVYYYAADEYGSTYHLASVQTFLTSLGHYTGPIRGGIGPITEAAILAFQNATPGLTADKDPGPLTMAALASAVAAQRAAAAKLPGVTAELSTAKASLATTTRDLNALKVTHSACASALAHAEAVAADLRTQLETTQAALTTNTARAQAAEAALAVAIEERDAALARSARTAVYEDALLEYANGRLALESAIDAATEASQ